MQAAAQTSAIQPWSWACLVSQCELKECDVLHAGAQRSSLLGVSSQLSKHSIALEFEPSLGVCAAEH